MSERDWLAGNRAAYARIMSECAKHVPGATSRAATLSQELEDVRSRLEKLGEQIGCEAWPDHLHLADVLDKYILPQLDDLLKDDAR